MNRNPQDVAARRKIKANEKYKHGVRPYDFIPFEANKTRFVDIPLDRPIKAIGLHLSGSLVVSDATDGAVLEDGVLNLIKNVIVSARGHEQKWKIDARSLYFKNAIEYGILGVKTDPSAATDATYSIALYLRIPFENDIGINPADTFMDSRKFTTFRLGIEWGAAADVFDADFDGAAAISSSYGITPVYEETTEWDDIAFERRVDYIPYTVTADNTAFKIELEPEGRVYQNIMFMATDADVRSASILKAVSLNLSGGIRVYDTVSAAHILNENKRFSRLGSNFPTGVCYINLLEQRGKITRGLDVSNPEIKTADFILDVAVGSGTTKIIMVQDYLVPAYAAF